MNLPENLEITTLEELLLAIHNETRYLETYEGEEVECISIDVLEGLLKRYFKNKDNE